MNKKGQIFSVFLVFVSLILLIMAFTVVVKKQGDFEFKVGEFQISLLSVHQKVESALFYVDQSAKYALIQSVYDLSKESTGCGTYKGFGLWLNKSNECFPEQSDIKANLEMKLNSNLNEYLARHSLFIPQNNYYFSFNSRNNLKVIGSSKNSIVMSFGGTSAFSAQQIDEYFKEKNSPLVGTGQCFVEVAATTGIPVVAMMGITVLESNWGRNDLAGDTCSHDLDKEGPSYNLFSIKGEDGTAGYCKWRTRECFSQEEVEKECDAEDVCSIADIKKYKCERDGKTEYQILAPFKAYQTKCDSINDLANLIQKSRYWKGKVDFKQLPDCKPVKDVLDDPAEIIRRVGYCGYATDPEWSNNIISAMNNMIESLGVGTTSGSNGIYSVKPNFRTEINYSLNEYEDLTKELDKIILEVRNKECTLKHFLEAKECIEESFTGKEFKWSSNDCLPEKEKVFYDLIEGYELCTEDGICRIPSPDTNNEYNILFEKKDNKIVAKIDDLEYQTNLNQLSIIQSGHKDIDFAGSPARETCTKLNFKISPNGAELTGECAVSGDNFAYIYQTGAKNIFLYVEGGMGYFFSPAVVKSYASLKPQTPTSDMLKLCARSNYVDYFYDGIDKATKQRNIIYRIAAFAGQIEEPVIVEETAE